MHEGELVVIHIVTYSQAWKTVAMVNSLPCMTVKQLQISNFKQAKTNNGLLFEIVFHLTYEIQINVEEYTPVHSIETTGLL